VPAATDVRGPLAASHAWRLVSVTGRIQDTRKLGDRWRSEVSVGEARIVVVGQPGAGIEIGRMPEGATVEVTGIVRLAYPNATDSRPSLLPRSPVDIVLRAAAPAAGSGAAGTTGDEPAGAGGTDRSTSGTTGRPAVDDHVVPTVDLADLAARTGTLVRVGGLVRDLRPTGFVLDDATATAPVLVVADAAVLLPLIEPGDAVNVVGRVIDADAGPAIQVGDPAGLALLPQPSLIEAGSAEPSAPGRTASAAAPIRSAGMDGVLDAPTGLGAGLLSLGLMTLLSVVVTILRRRHAERLLAARVTARLTALTGSATGRAGPATPIKGGSTAAAAPPRTDHAR
jgi:hypothetical protein